MNQKPVKSFDDVGRNFGRLLSLLPATVAAATLHSSVLRIPGGLSRMRAFPPPSCLDGRSRLVPIEAIHPSSSAAPPPGVAIKGKEKTSAGRIRLFPARPSFPDTDVVTTPHGRVQSTYTYGEGIEVRIGPATRAGRQGKKQTG